MKLLTDGVLDRADDVYNALIDMHEGLRIIRSLRLATPSLSKGCDCNTQHYWQAQKNSFRHKLPPKRNQKVATKRHKIHKIILRLCAFLWLSSASVKTHI